MTKRSILCIGRPIIEILARDGAWCNSEGEGVVAADELFRANPYQEIDNLRETVRAIELAVDGLNTKAFTQKPETQSALDRIKKHCRNALGN